LPEVANVLLDAIVVVLQFPSTESAPIVISGAIVSMSFGEVEKKAGVERDRR
jgi:hypothetical protein